MNIKKLFAALAGVSLFAQTVVPSAGVFGAEYSQELQDAYNWAYGKSITTMSSIDNANMYGAITRAELAKMLANWAKDKGQTPDTSKACTFTDTASVKGDLAVAIVEACQLGLMGQGITAFRPYDTISRAEFGTALSRALWGDKYEGGTPYYANHLNALKAAGIMNQIANAESTKEVRGYVMLMLMRAEGSEGSETDCDDPLIALACSTDSDACPAECKEGGDDTTDDGKVKAGDLAVTASESAGRKILATGTSDLDTLKFKTSEEVEITKITLERFGYSSNASVKEVWLENEDGAVITNKASLNSKGQANLTIKKDYRKVDGTFNATVVLDATSKAGETIGFKVIDADSTAKNLNIDNYKPYTYDVVVYSGTEVTFTIRNTEKTYNYEAGESYEVSKFKVKAPSDSSILVKGFTLTNTGNLDVEKHLDKVEVTVAGKTVKASANINKDDELVIGFDEDVEIAAKANVEFIVKMSFAEGFDAYAGTVWYFIAEAADFSAIDSKTESRVDLDSQVTAGKIGAATSWPKYTFNGGKVKLTNTKLGNVDGAQDSDDVVVAEGTITVPESIKGDLTINIIGQANTAGLSGSAKAISKMRLKVGSDEFEGETPVYGADGTTGSVLFRNVEIEEGGKVRFLVDIVEGSDYENLNVNFEIAGNGWSDFYYVEGKKTDTIDVAGSISFSKLTIQAGKASLKNSLTKKVEFKKGEVNRYVVFDGTYTAKKKDIKLNGFSIEGTGVSANTGIVTFYLKIDGDEVADMKLTGNNVLRSGTDTFTDVEIAAGDSVNVVVEAEVNAKSATGGNLGTFKLYLNGEDKDGNKAGNADAKTVELRIVDKGSVTIPTSTSKKTVLLREANSKVAEFVIKPANGASEVDIDSVSFILSGDTTTLKADDITVTFNGTTEDGTDSNATPNVISFEPNLTVGTEGATIVVSIDDEIDGTIVLTGLTVNGTDFTSRTFTKRYEPATAFVASQKGGNGTTTFKIGVETTDSSITVSNLKLIIGTGAIKADGTVATTTGEYAIAGDFSDGEEVEAVENGNNVQMITAIEYSWVDSSKTGAGSTGTVYVDKNTFGDYFKVGDEYAKIFKAN